MWILLLIVILVTIFAALLWLYDRQERSWQDEKNRYLGATPVSNQGRHPLRPMFAEVPGEARLPASEPVQTGKNVKEKTVKTAKTVKPVAENVQTPRTAKQAAPRHTVTSTPQWERDLAAREERVPAYPNREPAPKPLEHLHHSPAESLPSAQENPVVRVQKNPKAETVPAAPPRDLTFQLLEPEQLEPPQIITLEEATRNLNYGNAAEENTPAVPEKKQAEKQPASDLEVITLDEAMRGWQPPAPAVSAPEVLPQALEGEEIGLDEIMESVRERTLYQASVLPEKGGRIPEGTETISADEIRESLERQRRAQAHQQQFVSRTPADSLNIIGEEEVLANLANTDSPLARRHKKSTTAIPPVPKLRPQQAAPVVYRKTPSANKKMRPSAPAVARPAAVEKTAPSEPEVEPARPSVPAIAFDETPPKPQPAKAAVMPPSVPALAVEPPPAPPKAALQPVPAIRVDIEVPPIVDLPMDFPEPPDYGSGSLNESANANADDDWSAFAAFVGQEDSPLAYAGEYGDADLLLPPLELLLPAQYDIDAVQTDEQLLENGITIEEKLAEFRVKVKVIDAVAGPVITRYEIEPDVGVRGSSVMNLEKDLARSLGMASIRVLETIPGKNCMGIELPNPKRQMIRLSEIFNSPEFSSSRSKLTLALGQDITGAPVVTDLASAPHLLVAGTTGSGKSVGINSMILSMLFKASPEDVRLIMIDPKMLELSVYEGIPHLLAPVVTDMKLAANALNWCVGEMEKRYRLMSHLGVRNLSGYNAALAEAAAQGEKIPNPFSLNPEDPEPLEKLPFIVVVVDEFADLMMTAGKKIEELIARLAQKARAAGIHLILATQRPSVDVITGLIKANIPTRIAFQVPSKTDSRTILDQMGAENLLGQGDMLFLRAGNAHLQRVHGAFVADSEVHHVVEYLKQTGEPDYIDLVPEGNDELNFGGTGGERDPLFDKAVETVLRTQKPTISSLQRHLRIGYNKAATLVEQMEAEGILSPADHTGKRTILARSGGAE